MTVTIDLTPQSEAWLRSEARLRGVKPAEVIERVIEEQAITGAAPLIDAENAAAIAMLNEWIAEDATDDPEEIRKANEEVAELRRNLNANRSATGERLVSR